MDSSLDPITIVANSIADITISILNYIDANPGIDDISILNQMRNKYPSLSSRAYFNDDIIFIIDTLHSNGSLYFDFQEYKWYVVAKNPKSC